MTRYLPLYDCAHDPEKGFCPSKELGSYALRERRSYLEAFFVHRSYGHAHDTYCYLSEPRSAPYRTGDNVRVESLRQRTSLPHRFYH
jgi:hypothetical protein